MNKPSFLKMLFVYVLIGVFIFMFLNLYKNYIPGLNNSYSNKKYTYGMLINDIEKNNLTHIDSIKIKPDTNNSNSGTATVIFNPSPTDNTIIQKENISLPSISNFMEVVNKNSMAQMMISTLPPNKPSNFSSFLPIILVVILVLFLLMAFSGQDKGGAGKALSFGKNRAKLIHGSQTKVTFKDVAGLKEEKSDLEEIVEFLKDPKKFEEIGARIPKGILLVGSPGTGKTLLARAIAGEAGVKFFSISGSDFVEMFVGVGASRVRDLFEEAKKNKPALIFIDEIDAVGRRRGSGLGGGHDEREQTLNQLLVEMDGFIKNEGIIILAATNRPDILDPAILRPGRFDRQIMVGNPDVKGREDILKVHAKNKKLNTNINLEEIAKMTSGFTGAELENLLNEAALMAAKNNQLEINMEDIKKAFIKVGVGTERRSKIISEEEKKITAYHEAGHAILFEMLPLLDSVHIVSIIPTGSAGGYTMPLPVDKGYLSRNYLEQNIISFFGGRIAEDIIFNDITTGASNDIERATAIAKSMVKDYGMSKLGPIKFNEKETSQELSHSIDKEIEEIISSSYKKAKEIITEKMDILHSCANLLLKKEKITGDEFRALFKEGEIPTKSKPTILTKNEDEIEINNENKKSEENTKPE